MPSRNDAAARMLMRVGGGGPCLRSTFLPVHVYRVARRWPVILLHLGCLLRTALQPCDA